MADTGGGPGGAADTGGESLVCESADDCDTDFICDCIGRCVPPGLPEIATCSEDKNCGSGNYCDVCAKTCRPLNGLCEPCEFDNECDDDGVCVDFQSGGRFCLKACVGDVGCPPAAYTCENPGRSLFGQCVPLSGQCSTPELCSDDSDCEFGAICELGKCRPGCPGDDVCPDGQVCTAFRCVDACSETNPCLQDQECDDEGHCKVEGGCVEPKDCPAPETFCDPTQNLCQPGCLADFDCKASGKECKGGKCVDKGCAGNFFCAFSEVCNFGNGKCEKATGPHCEADCDPQSAETSCGDGNLCLSLQDKDETPLGDFCFVACGPDPNNACPQGYACQEVEEFGKKICFRDCSVTPLGAE